LQTLTLSGGKISEIDIVGAEICISEICYRNCPIRKSISGATDTLYTTLNKQLLAPLKITIGPQRMLRSTFKNHYWTSTNVEEGSTMLNPGYCAGTYFLLKTFCTEVEVLFLLLM
jgi:hypothetical protein